MRFWAGCSIIAACLLIGSGGDALSQTQQDGRYLIGIYRIAPGQHLDFLKWQAEREAIAKEAGAAPTQWYRHQDGDSWDFIGITKVADPAKEADQDEKIEALAKKRGLTTGFAAGLEIRRFFAYHTDTYALGPFTAQELVTQAQKR